MNENKIENINSIFSKEFQKIDTNLINLSLRDKGYFSFPNALTKEAVNQIEKDSTQSKLNINNNNISGVYSEKQYYFLNLLASSKAAYNFITSKLVLEVCNKYLGNSFRLKALRYYETYGGHHMRWHTDNKNDKEQVDTAGLIFIFYVSDVSDGQFQYIEGSHSWSGKKAYSEYSDEFVDKNYRDKVIDFKFPSGSLIIYNTYGIHRAKPVSNNKFIRKSVFFQIDSDLENAEPVILNTKFVTHIDSQISMILGFGKPANYEAFPITSFMNLPFSKNVFMLLLKYFPRRLMRNIFDMSPKLIKERLRKFFRKNHPEIYKDD
jgi:hypothetical protein